VQEEGGEEEGEDGGEDGGEEGGGGDEGDGEEAGAEGDDREGVVSAAVDRLRLGPDGEGDDVAVRDAVRGELAREEQERLRAEIEERIRERGGDAPAPERELEAAREVWSRTELLTSSLAGELAEQLRVLLEPTLASRLAGDYRTGKRLNMKRVIPYIASSFRKDRIWMRRTRPDKRRYQVVVAIDNSRSMQENGCGKFAVEALGLIARALSRLEVGEVGVVSFGGAGTARALHELGAPFTDEAGAAVVSQLGFDQDNTIADRPMTELMTFLDVTLEQAAVRAASTESTLKQLVLILADGRFHEKESLRRVVRETEERRGAMTAFIALDGVGKGQSLLDLKTVAFRNGQPVFSKYLDSFPFPFYILLREIAQLPHTLSDLLRQWFALHAH